MPESAPARTPESPPARTPESSTARTPEPATPEPAYFDAAAAAPLHPAARTALIAALADGWADPAKVYTAGRRAAHLLEAARAAVAETLGVRPEEVTFCPSGADACARAVTGLLRARRRAGPTLVHSAVEHSAVLAAAEEHARDGGEVVSVPVDRLGRVDLAEFRAAVGAPGVAAAALMSANHEVGTRQPVTEAAAACADAGVPLLVDAAQSAGRTRLPE